MKERARELHITLLEYQQKSVSELKPMSDETDVSRIAPSAIEQVKGKSLPDALVSLAMLGSLPNVEQLHAQTLEYRLDSELRSMFTEVHENAMGRVIGRQPDNEEEALLWDMFKNANAFRSLHVKAIVKPAHQQILAEHYIRLADFAPFVVHSPFIRAGRERIIARGLYAGMQGDFLTAVHFLVPQLEDSLRYILHQLKVITSGLDSDGIQDDYNVNQMLVKQEYTEPLAQFLGKNFVFDLRGLLVERPGANLRNDMAHGLISHNAFYSTSGYYLWWLALRFYAWPTVINLTTDVPDEEDDAAEEDSS